MPSNWYRGNAPAHPNFNSGSRTHTERRKAQAMEEANDLRRQELEIRERERQGRGLGPVADIEESSEEREYLWP